MGQAQNYARLSGASLSPCQVGNVLCLNSGRIACNWQKVPSVYKSIFCVWEVLSNTKKKNLEVLYRTHDTLSSQAPPAHFLKSIMSVIYLKWHFLCFYFLLVPNFLIKIFFGMPISHLLRKYINKHPPCTFEVNQIQHINLIY